MERGCEIVLRQCLAVRPGESVLVVTDTVKRPIGEALFDKAAQLGCEPLLLMMQPRPHDVREPPRVVAEAMKGANVVACPTLTSLTHTEARRQACLAGARVATMPGVSDEMLMSGGLTADYEEVAALTRRVAEWMSRAETVRIRKEGHELALSVKGRSAIPSTGLIHHPGEYGNVPSGEAYVAPVEATADGAIIFDGAFASIGLLRSPLRVEIRNGMATRFVGEQASDVQRLLGEAQENWNIAEFGIGTNRWAKLIGNILEDEKVYGTIHIAFGDNSTFGGANRARVHLDGIARNPTVYLDGEKIAEGGQLLLH